MTEILAVLYDLAVVFALLGVAGMITLFCARRIARLQTKTRLRLFCLGAISISASCSWWWPAEPAEIRELRGTALLHCGDRTLGELSGGFLEDSRWELNSRADILTITGTVRPDAAGIPPHPPHPPLRARFVLELDYCGAIDGYWDHPVNARKPPLFTTPGKREFAAVNAGDPRLLGYERFLSGFCPKAPTTAGIATP